MERSAAGPRVDVAAGLFRALASEARPAGSAAEGRARETCAAWLRESGFQVSERSFTYSAWPGRYGTAVVGAILFTLSAGSLEWIGFEPRLTGTIAGLALFGAGSAVVFGAWLARFGTRALKWSRCAGTNLEAARGVPEVWLVAHLDSKSQPWSLLLRAFATVSTGLAWIGVLGLWAWIRTLGGDGADSAMLLRIAFAIAALAGVPLVISRVGARGTGALDNVSGVAAVLVAARMAATDANIGVLITSAEELGLAGARAWLVGRRKGIVINCDGVDDTGPVTITAGRRGARWWREIAARAITETDVCFSFLLPGVLLDAVAFADAGWTACTVSRGGFGSLGRIHTRRDTLERMTGGAIDETARIIAALSGAIIAGG